jgi:hypothetical protein
MKYAHLVLIGILILLALVVGTGRAAPSRVVAATDSDGDGILDPADSCPSLAEDPDGVADLDGCPDTDVSASAAMDTSYTIPISSTETQTVDIWIQNGNYPADILVHALSVSTIGACEVSLIAAPGDGVFPLTMDEDGDTIAETYYYLLEWTVSLNAGESYHTTRDYHIVCSLLGEHSFEMQVDAVPLPPVEEEDVANLRNVHKDFPQVTVVDNTDPDSDGDGFSDSVEAFTGTMPNVACAATPAQNDEDPDAWPPDFNDDETVNILDIYRLTPPVFNSSRDPNGDGDFSDADPNYTTRKDFNGDGAINIVDVFKMTPPVFNSTCTP